MTTIRIAAIEVGHWYSLFDAACLKTLAQMPEVQLVGVQNPDAGMAAGRANELGGRAATGPEDCYRAMRIVDRAYATASPEG